MSQCCALFYPHKNGPGYYCVLEVGHRGDHQTDKGRRFTEEQATYLGRNRTVEGGQLGERQHCEHGLPLASECKACNGGYPQSSQGSGQK